MKTKLFLISLSVMAGMRADVKLNPLFTDHAVLQRDLAVPVWGTATPGEKVLVAFAGQTVSATTDADGRWLAELAPLPVSATPQVLTVKAANTVTVNDVLVGDVWLASGQSNMEWALSKSDGGAEAIASSANPMLRMCRVPHNVAVTPQAEVRVKWEVSGPVPARFFSAIPYWFGSKLQKELGVPIGIVNNSFGGTVIQSWMPAATLKNGPWPQDKWTDLALAKADYDIKSEAAGPFREKFEADKAAALARKEPAPPQPPGIPSEFKGATTLWNGEIVPLLPYRIRGVAWYQGESNAYANVATTYKDLLPALIKDWPDLPKVNLFNKDGFPASPFRTDDWPLY